jgi:hypothetical protein
MAFEEAMEEHLDDTGPPECEHGRVNWNPVETDYQADGTATVWQEGRCEHCDALLQLNYHPSEDGPEIVAEV